MNTPFTDKHQEEMLSCTDHGSGYLMAVASSDVRKLESVVVAVREAKPLLEHYERQLASSLSCDSRSHDNDRACRQQLNSILTALNTLDSTLNP